jgi:hypothetical protein
MGGVVTEPAEFHIGPHIKLATCDVCRSTRPLWWSGDANDKLEWQRLYSKAVITAGWCLIANRWHCSLCTDMLRSRMMQLPQSERLTVQSALADALFASRPIMEGFR